MDAELWFQPISYRWAANLRRYGANETGRFTKYYDAMASASAVILARASATGDNQARSRSTDPVSDSRDGGGSNFKAIPCERSIPCHVGSTCSWRLVQTLCERSGIEGCVPIPANEVITDFSAESER